MRAGAPLRRPIEEWVSPGGQAEVLLTKRVWGDGVNQDAAGGERQRGRLVRVYDGGGETRIEAYDLDGHATKVSRRMLDLPRMLTMAQHDGVAPRARMDWSSLGGAVALAEIDELVKMVGKLEDTAYVTTVRHDAQGRVVQTRLPMSGSTHRTSYTDDGLLERIDRETAAGTHERVYEAEDFDHLGRPRSVRHGEHAARTRFTYDPVTERLLRLQSQGGGRSLQDLHYSYDPVGNLTQVRDAAQAIVYRDNAALEAVNDYRYDALYRLVEATGREHEGQAANGRTPKAGDAVVVPLRASSPSDPKAMRRYVQRYRYDAVGNLRTLQHQAGAGSFRREYAYAEHGNRLRATGNAARALHERYAYDVAGHMVAMPHLSRLHWDETDALEFVQRGTQQIWLQYAGGVRVRKVVRSGEGVVEDRKYLGAEELYTKRRGGALVERTLTEHVGGALQVDIKLVADGNSIAKPVALRRYALADHLGSVKLEVDPDGQVIAYEEFHPYGTTSYRAMHSGLDAAANRYRYTGMEKDEETGLARHGARYYAAWLGRWTAPDPTGLADGVNRYAYCRGSPTGSRDRDGARTEDIPVLVGAGASEELVLDLHDENGAPLRARTWDETAADVRERYQEAQRANNEQLAWDWTMAIAVAQFIEAQAKPHEPLIQELYPALGGYFSDKHDKAVATTFDPSASWLERQVASVEAPTLAIFALGDSIGSSILNLPRNADLAIQHAMFGDSQEAAHYGILAVFGLLDIAGIAALRPRPPARILIGDGGLTTAERGASRRALGAQREEAVARIVSGKVAKVGGRDLKLVTAAGEGVTIDVLGPGGELLVVGGPAKVKKLGALGDRLRVLRDAAKEAGVEAYAYFEAGTPDSVLQVASRILGDNNVRTFPKVGA